MLSQHRPNPSTHPHTHFVTVLAMRRSLPPRHRDSRWWSVCSITTTCVICVCACAHNTGRALRVLVILSTFSPPTSPSPPPASSSLSSPLGRHNPINNVCSFLITTKMKIINLLGSISYRGEGGRWRQPRQTSQSKWQSVAQLSQLGLLLTQIVPSGLCTHFEGLGRDTIESSTQTIHTHDMLRFDTHGSQTHWGRGGQARARGGWEGTTSLSLSGVNTHSHITHTQGLSLGSQLGWCLLFSRT